MEKKEITLEEKQQRCVELSIEIARLHKVLGMRQFEFNKLDTEIYKELKSKESESQSVAKSAE